MLFLKKTIKENEVPISCIKFNYSGKKRLAVNLGLKIDIYSYSYRLIDTINLDCYIYQLCTIKSQNENLLFLVSKFEYLIFSGKSLISRNQFETFIDGNSLPCKTFTRSNSLIIFYDCGKWRLFSLNKEKILEKSSNDFFFVNNLLSVQYFAKTLFLCLKDYEDNVCLLQLQIKGSKNEPIFTNINNLPKNTQNIILFNDKIIVFFEGKLALYLKEELMYETNFANCELSCFLQINDFLLIFMKDGEVIQLKIDTKITIINIKKLKSVVTQIIKLKRKYFAITEIGSFFFIFDEELKIIAQSKDMSLVKFEGDLKFSSKTKQISELIITKNLKLKNKLKLLRKIHDFWFFNGKLIVSYNDKADIFDIKRNLILKTFEKIENFKVVSLIEAFFCTKSTIYRYSNNEFSELRLQEKILLSSFSKKMGLIYTGKEIYILENLEIKKNIPLSKDLTAIFIEDFIFLSSAQKECFFYDLMFNLLCKFTFKVILNVFTNEKEIFFVDHIKNLYCIPKSSLNLNTPIKAMPNLFVKLCKCSYDTTNFLFYENYLILISRNPQFLNLQTKSVCPLNIKNIIGGSIYKDMLVFSKGSKLYFYFNTFFQETTHNFLPYKKVEKFVSIGERKIILYARKKLKYLIDEKEIYSIKLPYNLMELVQCGNSIIGFFKVADQLILKFFRVKNAIFETKTIYLPFKGDSFRCKNNMFAFFDSNTVLIYKLVQNDILLIAKLGNLPNFINPIINFNRKNIFLHGSNTNFICDFQGNNSHIFHLNHSITSVEYNKYVYCSYKDLLLIFNSHLNQRGVLFNEAAVSDISICKSRHSNYIYYITNNQVNILAHNLVDKKEEEFLVKLDLHIRSKYKGCVVAGKVLDVDIILKYWEKFDEDETFLARLYKKLDDLS